MFCFRRPILSSIVTSSVTHVAEIGLNVVLEEADSKLVDAVTVVDVGFGKER